jgi:hypothetical protein
LSLPGGPASSRAVPVMSKVENVPDARRVQGSVHSGGILGHKELSEMGTISIEDSPPQKRLKKCQDEKAEEDDGKSGNFGLIDVSYSEVPEDGNGLKEEDDQDEEFVAAFDESLQGDDDEE